MALSPASAISRLPPQPRGRLNTPLEAQGSAALRVLSTAGLLRPAMAPETVSALTDAGYVRQALGGDVVLSDVGRIRAMMEFGT